MTFYEFGLSHDIIRAVSDAGFEEATPIQTQVIPIALQGKDLIGQAQTGTGKTAAFGLPLLEKIRTRDTHVQAIVLAPTRELAIQVADELTKFAKFKGVRLLPVFGGQDMSRQLRALRNNPHVIVGTPGRVLDHIRRRTLHLEKIETVVLDEADEMLNMGFLEDIQEILGHMPAERQTMLFSATMPPSIRALAQTFLRSPEIISVTPKEVATPQVTQYYYEIPENRKFDVLCRLLDIESPSLAIIFGRTKRRVDELTAGLQKLGYQADGLHGDLSQNQRNAVMRKFREGNIDILVATDVAARGLDVSDVSHVVNFDIPQDPESYVHRVGRTGRAGREGVAMTFVSPRETGHLHFIERTIKHKLLKRPIPTLTDAFEGLQKVTVDRLIEIIESGEYDKYEGVARSLLDDFDSTVIVAAALKLVTRERKETQEVQLTPEVLRVSKARGGHGDGRRKAPGRRSEPYDRSGFRGTRKRDGKPRQSRFAK